MKRFSKYKKPSWFDLNNYSELNEIKPSEWAYQLHIRSEIFHLIYHKCDYCGKFCKKSAKEKFHEIKNKPIKKHQGDFIIEPSFHYGEEHKIPGLNFISPLSRSAAYLAPLGLPLGKEYECTDKFYIEENGVFDAQFSDLGSTDGLVFLFADLTVSNEILFDEFKTYIDHVRKFYGFEDEKVKQSIFKRLYQLKVIPFLDLHIHSHLTNCEPDGILSVSDDYPYHIYGDWLFPFEEVDVSEKVRKNTKPLALRSKRLSFIRSLANMTE